MDLLNSANASLGASGAVDQHGSCAHLYADLTPLEITEKWVVRIVPLPAQWVGTSLEKVLFACQVSPRSTSQLHLRPA